MKLTQFTDYALRTLIFLGGSDKELQSIAAISEAYSMPHSTVMKIVSELVRLNYVESVRGRLGGIRLAIPAEEIILGSVIRSIEESFELADCGNCILSAKCKLKGIFRQAIEAFMAVLDSYSLADLLNEENVAYSVLNVVLPAQAKICLANE